MTMGMYRLPFGSRLFSFGLVEHLFRYSTEVDGFEYLKINRASLPRDNTRAGFETPTVFAPLKLLSSLVNELRAYTTVRSGDTKHLGLLLIRRHVLLKGLALSLKMGQ
jgi:hypothetical protein